MGNCPICKTPIEGWETLCSNCWKRAENAYKFQQMENGELVEKLKGKAKTNLFDLMKEICRHCPKFEEEVSDPACENCVFKEKEKLIRAFVE